MIARTRSRKAGKSSLLRSFVSITSCRYTVTVPGRISQLVFLLNSKRADHADRHDGRAELHRHAEYSILERAHSAIARPLPFRKHSEAHA